MRVVITRVKEANVKIDDKIVGAIQKGFLLLVGFKEGDNEQIIDKLVDKISKIRIFEDENGLTNLSIFDVNGDILSISQFTLYADTKKGNRPSFINALKPEYSSPLYDLFNKKLKEKGLKVEQGIFGSDMKVYSINDGPFTIILDSDDLK
ncbi:MAG: D-aminoacyl-tRNA deacylase [Bacilli bacterium]